MQRLTMILAGLLGVQVLLAGVLHLGGSDAAVAEGSAPPLAAFKRSAIDAVRIEGPDGKTLRVERGGDGWRLPGSDGFPAKSQSVERLLRDLGGFEQRLPVARSASARERFKVGASNYERRVTLLADGEAQATVLFGSSAGTGRVYARAKGQDMVYEVGFPLWHAAVDPAKWHDRSVAQVKPSSVVQARMPGFIVRRKDEGPGWRVAADGDTSAAAADAGAAAKLVRRLAQPGFRSVAKAKPPEGEPTLAYTLTTRDGRTVRYRYFTAGDGKKPTLYRAGQPWAYVTEPKQLAQVRSTRADTLLASAGEGPDKAAADAQGQKAATATAGGAS